jgi:hypothetical protein
MRLLKLDSRGEFILTTDIIKDDTPYAILSHTWGADKDEVTFDDLQEGSGKNKDGYAKIRFCGEQARKDGLQYFWVDSCCIKKSSDSELSESTAPATVRPVPYFDPGTGRSIDRSPGL